MKSYGHVFAQVLKGMEPQITSQEKFTTSVF